MSDKKETAAEENTANESAAPNESAAAVESAMPESAAGESAAAGGDDAAPQSVEEQLAASEQKAGKYYDDYLRAVADLENFRRQAEKRNQDTAQFVLTQFALSVSEVRDCLEQALAAKADAAEAMREGVELTLRKLASAMETHHISPINPDIGVSFDPTIHMAIGTAAVSEQAPADSVAQVIQTGYMLHGRVIRPANVLVAKAAESNESASNESAAAGGYSETSDSVDSKDSTESQQS